MPLPDEYVEHGNVELLKQEVGIDARIDHRKSDHGSICVLLPDRGDRDHERTFGCIAGQKGTGRIQREGQGHHHVRQRVYVDGQREDKAGTMFEETADIEVRGHALKYVSRGGLKLEKAMDNFDVMLEGKVCMDVGASTGGFTDCMLQNGAVKVYSVDVGHGQLAWKLRQDPRVVCMEKTNIRYVTPEDIQEPTGLCLH